MSQYEDRQRLAGLFAKEVSVYVSTHPKSQTAHQKSQASLVNGVPMLWMAKWPGPFPIYVDSAKGAHFTDLDGNDFTDFCLGDTGAMSGHASAPTVKAVQDQIAKGATFMLPTLDAAINAETLGARFGLAKWQFTLSATDANRHLIRFARQVTGRTKIAVHDYCYHGSVDETFAVLDHQGNTISRPNNIGKPSELHTTTVSLPFNDLAAAEKALATGEVALLLIEPGLTNIGIVLPEAGYLEGLQALCKKHDVIFALDETHTLSAGAGGITARDNLKPDAVVLGKTIGGGVPVGAIGFTEELSEKIANSLELESIDVGGVGGTLAGNALSMAAVRATLEEVLTPKNFSRMEQLAITWQANIQATIDEYQLPWQVSRIGCRGEYSFRKTAPTTGAEAAAAEDFELGQFLQLHAINQGILMTPFHNMVLVSPDTTAVDIEKHHRHFRDAVELLFAK
ncbi:transaminase [Aquiluna sp. Uisw_065]|uniref:transaminase n=1 Tax=Aquiluna sp. Uisw_065 TaxID=3230967 RepID=UPI0039E952D1